MAYGSSQARSCIRTADTARATPDLNPIWDLHHSSQQHQILNPVSETRYWTCIFTETSPVLNSLSHNGNSQQHQIRATSGTYATACGNVRSLTHWARPGIKPTSSWILVLFLTRWTTTGTPGFTFWSQLNQAEGRAIWRLLASLSPGPRPWHIGIVPSPSGFVSFVPFPGCVTRVTVRALGTSSVHQEQSHHPCPRGDGEAVLDQAVRPGVQWVGHVLGLAHSMGACRQWSPSDWVQIPATASNILPWASEHASCLREKQFLFPGPGQRCHEMLCI